MNGHSLGIPRPAAGAFAAIDFMAAMSAHRSVDPQRIATAGLVLEPLTAAHAEEMFEVLSDPAIYRYLDQPAPASIDALREIYVRRERRLSPEGDQIWLNWVIRVGDGTPAGYVQATIVSPDDAWIAYVLASKYWGCGYGFAAMSAMLEHLTVDYAVRRFLATAEIGNERSIRLLEHLGFRPATEDATPGRDLPTGERLFARYKPRNLQRLCQAPSALPAAPVLANQHQPLLLREWNDHPPNRRGVI